MSTGARVDVAAGMAALLALPVVTWALVGDLSQRGPDVRRALAPPALDPGLALALVVLAGLVLGVALVVLLRRGGVLRRDPRWWLVAGPLLLSAAGAGAGGRVVTAATVDANIGAGLVVVLGLPLLGVVVVWSVAWSVYLVVRRGRDALTR